MAKKTMYKKFTTTNGEKVVSFEGKLHNWEGPAFITADGHEQYWIYGLEYSKEEWKAAKRDHNGLPWHKSSGVQARF